MNSVDVDRMLREKTASYVVPQFVDQQFEETLFRLPSLSVTKRKRNLRRLVWTAACFTFLVGGFVVSVMQSPEVSITMQKVPVVGKVIAKISDYREWSVTDQGITMIVDRVRDDGRMVSADITFRSSKITDQTPINYLLKMDDTIVSGNGGALIRSTGSNTFQATLQESLLKAHKDSYHFNLYVTNIGKKRGKWFLSVPVVKDTHRIITLNQEKSSNEIDLKLKEIRVSPLSTEINIDYVKKQNPEMGWGFALVDDSDIVQFSFASLNYYMDDKVQSTSGNESHLVGPLSAGSKSVRIIPFTFEPMINTGLVHASRKTLERTPTESDPIELSQGKNEKIFVTGIEFKQDRTQVRIRIQGSNPTIQMAWFFLENKYGNTMYPLSNPQIRLNQKDYTLEFPVLSPDITFAAYPTYPIKLKPELEFNVNIGGIK